MLNILSKIQYIKDYISCTINPNSKPIRNATALIVDDFSDQGSHGHRVENEFKKSFNGNIERYNVGGAQVNISTLADGIEYGVSRVENIVHINLSFGAGSTKDPDGLTHQRIYNLFKRAWEKDISVTVSAGNAGNRVQGVSLLASSPWTWSVGSVDQYGNFADFSQHFPRIVDAFAYGPWGTSGAAPYLGGSFAELKRRCGLSNCELRTLFKQCADPLRFRDTNPPKEFHYLVHNKDRYLNSGCDVKLKDEDIIRAVFYAYMGRQPDEDTFGEYVAKLGSTSLNKVVDQLIDDSRNSGDWMADKAPVMDRIQSVFHLHFRREPTDRELSNWANEVMNVDRDMTSFSINGIKSIDEYDTLMTTNGYYTNWKNLIKGIIDGRKEKEELKYKEVI